MNLLPFKGYMIPGLHFEECCLCVFNWYNNPTDYKKLIEVWVLCNNGKRICYANPGDAEPVIRKYHTFDEVIPADIRISKTKKDMSVKVIKDDKEAISLKLAIHRPLKFGVINFLIKRTNRERISQKGQTETGKLYQTIPKKLVSVSVDDAEFIGSKMKQLNKPRIEYIFGKTKPPTVPLINYCTHLLEE